MAKLKPIVCLLAAFLLILSPLAAAKRGTDKSQEREIATAVIANSGIDWAPNRDYDGAELVVSGPDGEIFRGAFASGAPLFYDFLDQDGNPLRDGSYKYELVFRPVISDAVRERLQQARETGDDSIVARLEAEGLLPKERMVLSGAFTLVDGLAVDPDLPESEEREESRAGDDPGFGGVSPQDFVIVDDLIVDGSACVGFDCVNGENFGFDTIRLKENNLRIHFDDTSNSGSFPNRDWRIVANDSANGGANKFSIEDSTAGRTPFTIEADARTNALFVESDGDIGFGTSNPVVDLHYVTGNTPTLRLDQDGSSGFTPQAWDLAGNETNFFVRDVTNGSLLPFRIRPSAPTSSIDVASSGNVGMGTSSPAAPLHIKRTAAGATELLRLTNNGGSFLTWEKATAAENWFFTFENAAAGRFIIDSDQTAGPEFTLTNTGDLQISGGLVTGTVGSCTVGTPCDGVFQSSFDLPTIEEHSEFMWKNSFLQGVGPTPDGATSINLTQKTTGILHELELAHIYIEQLTNRLKQLEAKIATLAPQP